MMSYRFTAVHDDDVETIYQNHPDNTAAMYEAVSWLMANPDFDLIIVHDVYRIHIGTAIKATRE